MAITRRRLMMLTTGAVLAGALPATASDTVRMSGRAFGTSWHVRLRSSGDLEALGRGLVGELERVDRAMSPFRADSAITRFNARPAGWHQLDPDLSTVTAAALRIAAASGGAFDPSVGPDVERYGFGPIRGERAGDHDGLAVEGEAIWKADSRLTLDLCGIAKGYALDLMARRIEAAGYMDFVAEIGGEVLARGADAGGAPWRIGISDPLGGGLHAVVDTKSLALATSGDAVNAYSVGGRRYSHIIDPRTDEPVRNSVASVSVLADTAMTADALATALMVMGPEAGIAYAAALGVPALYLLRRPDGRLDEVASPAYDRHRTS
jgi:thiamine biosynthesis lipoprotein